MIINSDEHLIIVRQRSNLKYYAIHALSRFRVILGKIVYFINFRIVFTGRTQEWLKANLEQKKTYFLTTNGGRTHYQSIK